MNKVRRDLFWHEIRARRFRMAIVILALPSGWSMWKNTYHATPVEELLTEDDLAVMEMEE